MSHGSDVAIVGPEPAGLFTAIVLRRRGHSSIVLDQRSSLASLPAAQVANTCTLEAFAEMGVSDRATESAA